MLQKINYKMCSLKLSKIVETNSIHLKNYYKRLKEVVSLILRILIILIHLFVTVSYSHRDYFSRTYSYTLITLNFSNFTVTLQDLIHMNQRLLRALGTSHPNSDIICNCTGFFTWRKNRS